MNIGEIVQDRYRIVKFLGRGGMGAVYLCEDQRLPGKHWALKEMVVYDPVVAEQVKDSFIREAQMLAGLRHRTLPVIVDYFSLRDKQYLVMEYIEGDTLATFIQQEGTPSETQVLRWALELAQVLDYLHRQERPVIFRDLKPENIIVTADHHVKLVDFGLARHFEPGKRRDTQACGSVGYAPPEQWEDLKQTDARSDIYSLGATLYYVLTGKPPSPIYGSHRIRPHRPSVDTGLEALVLKCLQPDPSQRYANAAELITDLLLLLSDEKHQQEMPQTPEPRRKKSLTQRMSERRTVVLRNRLGLPQWLPLLLFLASLTFIVGAALGLRPPGEPAHRHLFEVLEETRDTKRQVRQLLESGDRTAAISLLDSLVTRYPEDAEAHILLQNAYASMNPSLLELPVVASLSGRDSEGFQLLYGLALAQERLNRAQGIGGKKVVLKLYDVESDVSRAVEVAGTLVKDPNTQIIVGPFTSQTMIAMAPLVNQYRVPLMAPTASDPRVWALGDYIFTCSETDEARVEAVADYFLKRGLTRGAILRDDGSHVSRSTAEQFIEYFQEGGGYVTHYSSYQQSTQDFRAMISEMTEAKTDFIFLADYRITPVTRFLGQLRAAGMTTPVASQNAAFSEELLREGEAAVDGLLLSTYFHTDIQKAEIQEFGQVFERTFSGISPSHREANAYDCLLLVARAIEEVGFERGALRDYLASLGEDRPAYEGVTGRFAPGRRLEARKPYLVKIRGGKFVLQ